MDDDFDHEAALRELTRAVRRACPSWLAHDAEDIAHDVLRRVLDRRRLGEGIAVRHVSYWRKAAHHALLNEIRRRRLAREESLEDEHGEVPHAPSGGIDPERAAASRALGAAIVLCLRTLSDGRRRMVVLFLQGHTVPESALLLGWQLKRAESAVLRGLKDLRACLTGKGWSP